MNQDQAALWIAPAAAISGLLISAVVAWHQRRRDLKIMIETGIYPQRTHGWIDVLLLIGSVAIPAGAISFLKDNRAGGAQPVVAVTMALVALGFHILLLPRIKGRVDVAVGVICGAIMALMALVYAKIKFL